MEETDANESFPFIIVGNKIDLVDQRKVSKEKALQWCKNFGNLEYFEVSAKDATNVEVAFNELAKHAADSNVENKPLSDIPSDLGMPPPDTEAPSGCSC
jgi:Ras-related protein Rab-7A